MFSIFSFIVPITALWLSVEGVTDLQRLPRFILGLLFYLLSVVLAFSAGHHEPAIRHWICLWHKLDNSDPEVCKKILDGTIFDGPLGENQLTLTESRARPNRRLVRAFGIDNGFTTVDNRWALAFKRLASGKLRENVDWVQLAQLARLLVSRRLQSIPRKGNHKSLNELIQSMTLKISVKVLFANDPLELDDEVTLEIASRINSLWISSKDPNADCREGLRKLNKALATAGLDLRQDACKSVLDLMLPAYETLWRVVLRCFLEIQQAQKFIDFSPGDTRVSVSFLVNETLRLYPPTKRIYREIHLPSESKPRSIAADIEGCHRRKSIWGPESEQFVPSRWGNTTPQMRSAFMPFGGQPFLCPAKPEFGPKMIGLLVGALITHVSPQEWGLASLNRVGLKEVDLGYGSTCHSSEIYYQ